MSTPGLPSRGPHVFLQRVDASDRVVVDGDPGHHLARVLRVRTGDPVSLADGSGSVWQTTVATLDGDRVVLGVDQRHDLPAPTPSLAVVQALPKGRKMDEVVQRLTEVGIDRLTPVVTARTVKQPAGKDARLLDRWRAVELAAAQQSRRARRMTIDPIALWPSAGRVGVVLWEEADTPLEEALATLPTTSEVTLAIGPEGGFTHDEVHRCGLTPARLGSTILRTETAGLVAATLAGQHHGRYR